MDENMAHCSYEAGILEDPNTTPPKDMWKLTVDPLDAPNAPEDFVIHFEKGLPVKLETNGKVITEPLDLFLEANAIARRNGVGRIDIVESRYTGSLKSRGCYESPGLTLLRNMHIDLEGLTLDREVRALRDQFVTFNFGKILYNGGYFTPEREFLSATLEASQKTVNGFVRGRCYKGSVFAIGRKSETENLYDENESSMDILGGFEPSDAGVCSHILKELLIDYLVGIHSIAKRKVEEMGCGSTREALSHIIFLDLRKSDFGVYRVIFVVSINNAYLFLCNPC